MTAPTAGRFRLNKPDRATRAGRLALACGDRYGLDFKAGGDGLGPCAYCGQPIRRGQHYRRTYVRLAWARPPATGGAAYTVHSRCGHAIKKRRLAERRPETPAEYDQVRADLLARSLRERLRRERANPVIANHPPLGSPTPGIGPADLPRYVAALSRVRGESPPDDAEAWAWRELDKLRAGLWSVNAQLRRTAA